MQRIKTFYHHNPLGVRLLAAILIYSSLITLFATGFQLWSDYRYERSDIDKRLYQIETSSIRSLSNSLWEINPAQVQIQLDGLLQLPDVRYLEITTPYGEAFFAGSKPESGQLLQHNYTLTHQDHNDKSHTVGKLTLIVSLEDIYQRLADKVLLILATQGVKTFLVSVFILTLFHHLITRHLSTMALFARRLKLDHLDQTLELKRGPHNDELNDVVSAFNSMRRTMLDDIKKRQQAERALESANEALADLNKQLEQRVAKRTEQLEDRNRELQQTLNQLQNTQKQLVESEKMAALGELVAGVAHEINTPIGIGFTAATFLADEAKRIEARSDAEKSDPDSKKLLALTLESSDLICRNLERAAQLIRAFKQVSVDQSSEQRRRFDLISYLHEILVSLQPRLKNCRPKIQITGPNQLIIDSYPGSYYQIFNNLIINSVIHGFEQQPGGEINISIILLTETKQRVEAVQQADFIQIDYTDNGVGVQEGWHQKLFEPFVTSKRHQDCSGLGMHISYNIVHQLLRGQIKSLPVQRDNPGAHFRLTLPVKLQPDKS
ncbi:sensor histidine kinase [Oceanospirillum linum]|uniref:histidine kinase n=1 Tax=Oceanospirillum linum TaxID=966 RepID=A0A1T1HDR2_OCELI|nr:ATP-binding protein [Oceanospirillum linum]OOV88001.1 histidine kinase [Oceanospirillum linum]SEF40074.1 Histidine kinase-, DNA gyrase B-, and HSP90-like ATPase [Oleiphilus messinensis]SMP00433.1 Histidine kinase-, DNA gyrase B-, and HSP90-like ATPase [Oceanospirillum linum]